MMDYCDNTMATIVPLSSIKDQYLIEDTENSH